MVLGLRHFSRVAKANFAARSQAAQPRSGLERCFHWMVMRSVSGAKAELLKNFLLLLPAFREIITDKGTKCASHMAKRNASPDTLRVIFQDTKFTEVGVSGRFQPRTEPAAGDTLLESVAEKRI
jgi:hypothetical protein